MKNDRVLFIAQAAVIAAVYVVLCVVFAPISYGPIQTRIAEALVILPYFTPAAVPGLFVGCLIANIYGGGVILDVVGGSIATLIGACGTYLLRGHSRYLASVPPVIANSLIIPFVLKYGYGIGYGIPFMIVTVAIGEILTATIMGTILQTVLLKYRHRIFG